MKKLLLLWGLWGLCGCCPCPAEIVEAPVVYVAPGPDWNPPWLYQVDSGVSDDAACPVAPP
jgi:hypothetical protein